MNFQDLKNDFAKCDTIIIQEENNVIASLKNLDSFIDAIEDTKDATDIKIINCNIYDYGYLAEITVIINQQDGENYTTIFTLTATSLY